MGDCPGYDSAEVVYKIISQWTGTPLQKASRWYGTPELNGVPPPPSGLGWTTDWQAAQWIAANYVCPNP